MSKSKQLRYYLLVLALFLLPVLKMQAADGTTPLREIPSKEAIANMTDEQKSARLEEIKTRVAEIKAMDRSMLTKEDRKALRKELKEMRREARTVSGVYISVGALIIIILLLIIIL
ncbi:MAG: hypothetical protein J0H74_13050 [Chitinophagaceae bacterium]|nr:hypothetical protein [Chitinophagaceae bacterium]